MNNEKWISWKLQTSRTWEDIKDVLELTRIDFIDYDHKMLIEFSIELNRLISETEAKFSFAKLKEIEELLNKLYQYAVDHFNREEAFMKKFDLPDTNLHIREHNQILEKLKKSLSDFQSGKIQVGKSLRFEIMDWLINHINDIDRNFFALENWQENLINANVWYDIKDIISLIGIESIDSQHMALSQMAIDLTSKINKDSTWQEINDAFNQFEKEVEYHFDFESEFSKKYNIPNTLENESEHKHFTNELREFKELTLADYTQVKALKIWILTWWINHINYTDQMTFKYENWALELLSQAKSADEMQVLLRRLGIETIDQDHMKVIEMAFTINQYITQKIDHLKDENKNELVSMFDKLYHLAKQHFLREENIMMRHQLVDENAHKIEHKGILDKILSLKTNYETNRLFISENVKTMLLEWWLHHTNNNDYRTFIIHTTKEQLDAIKMEEKL